MNRHERGLEFKVGVFVFVGLAMLGALVVQFGRLGEGFKTYYELTRSVQGCERTAERVPMSCSAARKSERSRAVRGWSREGNGVDVPLKIYDYVKIPEGSKFTVGSSGLLGDRFVNVTMPPGQPKEFICHLTPTLQAHAKLASTI